MSYLSMRSKGVIEVSNPQAMGKYIYKGIDLVKEKCVVDSAELYGEFCYRSITG